MFCLFFCLFNDTMVSITDIRCHEDRHCRMRSLPKAPTHDQCFVGYPCLSVYVNGKLMLDNDKVINTERAEINCSVQSYPESRIALHKGSTFISDNTSCSAISSKDSLCSLVVRDFDFRDGFDCEVWYKSPATGEDTKVKPDRCFNALILSSTAPFTQATTTTTNEPSKTLSVIHQYSAFKL